MSVQNFYVQTVHLAKTNRLLCKTGDRSISILETSKTFKTIIRFQKLLIAVNVHTMFILLPDSKEPRLHKVATGSFQLSPKIFGQFC